MLKVFKGLCPFMNGPCTSFQDKSSKLNTLHISGYMLQLVKTIPGFVVATTSGAFITEVHLGD